MFDMRRESLDKVLQPQKSNAPFLKILSLNGTYQLGYVTFNGVSINTMANGPIEGLLVLVAGNYKLNCGKGWKG